MAKDKTISIGVQLDMDAKSFKNLLDNCEEFRKALESAAVSGESINKRLINWGAAQQGISNMKNALSGLSTAINDITSESRSFGDAMRATNTMAGKDAQGFAMLKEQVTELAKTVPVARDALANGLYQVISNGVPEENWISFLEASARSSVGGMADLGQAVGVTSTLIKSYGASWEDAAAIQDKIQMTAKNGVTSFEQLSAALPRVAGNASTLGVSIDELMASFATLTGVSGNTAEVSTQLAAIFTSLVKPSSEACKMAAQMGIQFDAAAIKAKGGFSAFLTDLDATIKSYAAASGMLEQEIYGKLFGSAESLRALIPLQGELRDKFVSNIEAMRESAGTMDQAFEEMSRTGEAAAQSLKNKFVELGDAVSNFVAPVKPFLNMGLEALAAAANIGVLVSSMEAVKKVALGSVFGKAAIAVGLYSTAAGRATISTAGLTAATNATAAGARAASTAFRGLAVSLGAIGLVMGAVWAVTQAIERMKASAEEAALAQRNLNDIKEEAARRVGEETVKINTLLEAARDEKLSLDERHTAIGKLNSIIPDYNAHLDDTTGKYVENKKALDEYLKSLARQYEIEGAKDKLREIGRKKADLNIKKGEAEKNRTSAQERLDRMPGRNSSTSRYEQGVTGTSAWDNSKRAVESYDREIRKCDKDLGKLEEQESSIMGIYGNDLKKEAVKPETQSATPTPAPAATHTSRGSGGGSGGGSGKAEKPKAPEGSLQGLRDQMSEIDTKINFETDPAKLNELYREKEKLQERIDIRVNFQKDRKEIEKAMQASEIPNLKVGVEVDTSKLIELPAVMSATVKKGNALDKNLQGIQAAANAASQAFSGMGEALEMPALNVAGMLAQAIATMIMGYAQASGRAGMELGPWGWAAFGLTGLAQLAAMVSQVKSLTAFANGGIVSGPTMALVGEYAGASNNPEVIAPLDRLKDIIGDGGAAPVVLDHEIRISGGDLIIALRNASRSGAQSGRRTGITI